mgnify:CR=1 FL=1
MPRKPKPFWWMKPRPRYLSLTRAQKKLLDHTNRMLLECSRELYACEPEDAPAIGEKYADLLGFRTRILTSQWPEEPWFPGALTTDDKFMLREKNDFIILNPKALDDKNLPALSIVIVIVKPRLDEMIVVNRNDQSFFNGAIPMQNPHVFILPYEDMHQVPGIKHIKFNEDYQYLMIDPEFGNTIPGLSKMDRMAGVAIHFWNSLHHSHKGYNQ